MFWRDDFKRSAHFLKKTHYGCIIKHITYYLTTVMFQTKKNVWLFWPKNSYNPKCIPFWNGQEAENKILRLRNQSRFQWNSLLSCLAIHVLTLNNSKANPNKHQIRLTWHYKPANFINWPILETQQSIFFFHFKNTYYAW